MAAGAQMIAHLALTEMIARFGQTVGTDQSLFAQQLPCGGGVQRRREFRVRIGTPVLDGGAYAEQTRCDQCQKEALIVGLFVFHIARELLEILAVPVPAAAAQEVRHTFADAVLGGCRSAIAGVVGDHGGETLILCAAPEGGLAQTGMSHYGNVLVIDVLPLCDDVIHHAASAICPHTDLAPFFRLAVNGGAEVGGDAVGEITVELVVHYIQIGHHRHGVARVGHFLHGRVAVGDKLEVEVQEQRNLLGLLRYIEFHGEFKFAVLRLQFDVHQSEIHLARVGVGIGLHNG